VLLGRTLGRGKSGLLAHYSRPLADSLARRKAMGGAGFEVFQADASGRPLRARFVPVGGDARQGVVIFLEDMDKIQAQAQQFKLAALGRLTAGVAHEIRNPLSAISYANELLLEEDGWPATQHRLLEIIRDNTRRLEKMVQEVLQLNRRDRAQKETVALAEFAARFVEEFCQIEKVDAAMFVLDVPAGLPPACFDRGHLNQVLWNLCRNAVRHCRQGSASVRLEARPAAREGYALELRVVDDGPGVDEAARARLFEPFFTTSSQGTGLGLYVAREICEANDAVLEYDGTRTGGCFCVLMRGEPC
jgi:two-component system sensor histidine kinase PilS (NtrC family)